MHRLLVITIFLLASACASTEDRDERLRPPDRLDEVSVIGVPQLAEQSPEIATPQLYPGEEEGRLPILTLGSGDQLTLRFDLLADAGRPLSVFFYHADREWRRDLSPGEYLSTFHRDQLLDYRPSEATEVRYQHFVYRFPNESITFRVSGNYILRVTEQGIEDDVLFEMPFFITEQSVAAEMMTDNVLMAGSGFTGVQPTLLFRPERGQGASPTDFSTCFVRNGRFSEGRCATRPSLIEAPMLRFYLPPDAAFRAEGADYFLDLGLLQVGQQIEDIDYGASPFRVTLSPDYAHFGGTGLAPLQYGRPVVQAAVRDRAVPALQSEYLDVQFALVPGNEVPYMGEVYVIGAFNAWTPTDGFKLSWNAERRRYEGRGLVKQGAYEYRYWSRDARLNRALNESAPRPQNTYQAFIYYDDISVGTDRLLTVSGISAR